MKQLTEKEIQDAVKLVIASLPDYDEFYHSPDEVEVSINEPGHILFEATKMYDWDRLKITDEVLEAFRQFFGADNVEHYDDISIGGCESCDYGSTYGFAIRLWDNKE